MMRAVWAGFVAVALDCSALIIDLSPLADWRLKAWSIYLIWSALPLVIYAGVRGSRWWWLLITPVLPLLFLWLLAQGHGCDGSEE